MTDSKYIPTIGIETHVQLNTKTKLFSAVGNDARGAPPNTLISHICVGMPGALPVLNHAAIELCVKAALALGIEPQPTSFFERKHYFYPDLPKGYQITQYAAPIIIGGHLHFQVDGQKKCVRIERANLEEDAGKNTHPAGADYSLVDLNRAGTPLLEIVSMPDIHSAREAKGFARELWLNMKYAGVTDGDLFHGHVRFDINVSLSDNSKKLGTRSEVKNLNSFRSVEAAVDYEINRQAELLAKGEKIIQETRGWDEAKQKTTSQRGKEEAEDYRYMPEPDVPPLKLSDKYITDIKKDMPRLPAEWRDLLQRAGVNPQTGESLLELAAEFGETDYLQIAASTRDPKAVAPYINWIINLEVPLRRKHIEEKGEDLKIEGWVRGDAYEYVNKMYKNDKISSNNASLLLTELLLMNDIPPDIEKLAEHKGYLQISDTSALEKLVAEVITANPKVATDIKAGQEKAIGFLVGQVMAKSKGQANPSLAQQLIRQQLGI